MQLGFGFGDSTNGGRIWLIEDFQTFIFHSCLKDLGFKPCEIPEATLIFEPQQQLGEDDISFPRGPLRNVAGNTPRFGRLLHALHVCCK